MALTPDNIIVLYRTGNADSLSFAQAYQTLHNLNNSQLIGLTCSGNEILSSYAEFQTEIENQVSPHITVNVKAILVGYGVPGGFMDGSDVIATTSRLARIGHTYSKQLANPLFNRRQYQDYDAGDAQNAIIASRIDAPSITVALDMIQNIQTAVRQGTANGTFYFDKYAVINSAGETAYFNDLSDFESRWLPILNVPATKTVFWDEYTDVVVPKLTDDSFMWAWKADRAGYTFFQDDKAARFFLYNADTDGAGEMRNSEDKRFPMLAISSGYVASAGAMSDPSPSGHLRPSPFFETLYRGATLGEAFLFATPFLDWTVGMVGDPLVSVRFPASVQISDDLSINTGWDNMAADLASAIAYADHANTDLSSIPAILLNYTDSAKIDLFTVFQTASLYSASTWLANYRKSASNLISYIINNSNSLNSAFASYLSDRGITVSELISIAATTTLGTQFFTPRGQWVAEVVLQTSTSVFAAYYFQMDVSTDKTFGTILYSLNTQNNQANWTFEQHIGSFVSIPSSGVTSNYSGLRVRYTSPQAQYLSRGTVFYYRVRQKDDQGNIGSYTTYEGIVST